MLTMSTVGNGSALTQYFTGGLAADNFRSEELDRSTWFGKGAETLGLSGEVHRAQFRGLALNRHPTSDEPLTPRTKANRRVAYDLTFSAPKSVSLLWAIGGDDRVARAVWSAAAATVGEIEAIAATRVRKGSASADRATGNVVGAAFLHTTARAVEGIPDPQLHVHAVVFNATWDAVESSWKALQLGPIRSHAPLFQAIFHTALAREMERLGYGVVRTDTGWELSGFERSLIERFSRRTGVIERAAIARGVKDPREKAGLGAKTREAKRQTLSMDVVRREWAQRLTEADRATLAALASRPEDPAARVPEHRTPDPVKGLKATERSDPFQGLSRAEGASVQRAISATFERSAAVPAWRLVAAVMKALPGKLDKRDATKILDRAEFLSETVDGVRYVTSTEVLREERRLTARVRSGLGTCERLLDGDAKPPSSLNRDAVRAFGALASSTNRIVVIEALAGPDQEALADAVHRAKGLLGAPIRLSAREARERPKASWRLGKDAPTTVGSFLAGEVQGKRRSPSLVWIERAEALSVNAANNLFEWAARQGSRVVLCGDAPARRASARAGVIDLIARDRSGPSVRLGGLSHQEPRLREVTSLFAERRGRDAFDRLNRDGLVVEDRERPHDRLADRAAESFARGRSFMAVGGSRAECSALNAAIRDRLVERGSVGRGGFRHASRPELETAAERRDAAAYRRGQFVEFHQHCGLGRQAGTRWRVRGSTPFGVLITRGTQVGLVPLGRAERFSVFRMEPIEVGSGERIRLTRSVRGETKLQRAANQILGGKPRAMRLSAGSVQTVKRRGIDGRLILANGAALPRDFVHFEHAYAATPESAATRSADQVALLVRRDNTSIDSSRAYAAASRANRSFEIYTDDRGAARAATAREPAPATAHELLDRQRQRTENGRQPDRAENPERNRPVEQTRAREQSRRDGRSSIERAEGTNRDIGRMRTPDRDRAPDKDR